MNGLDIASLERFDEFERALPELGYDPTLFSLDQGGDAVLDEVFSYTNCNKLKNNWPGANRPTQCQEGMIWYDTDVDKWFGYDGSVDIDLTLVGKLEDLDGSNYLELKWNENDAVDRILNFLVNGANRSISLSGDLTVEAASLINQDLTTDASPTFAGLNLGTGELTAASINRASGTLSLEIGGVSVIDILSGYVNVKQKLFVNETVNTKMTTGITINQGAADNELLAGKSSDVAHGVTNEAETDTYILVKKEVDNYGGARILGITEQELAVKLYGIGVSDDVGKTSAAIGYVVTDCSKKSGVNAADVGANANIFVVRSHGTSRAIIDKEGTLHLDDTTVPDAWDDYDDIVLASDLSRVLARKWDEALRYDIKDMHNAGLLTYTPKEKSKANRDEIFINVNNMLKFGFCTFRQIASMLNGYEQRITSLESQIKLLEA